MDTRTLPRTGPGKVTAREGNGDAVQVRVEVLKVLRGARTVAAPDQSRCWLGPDKLAGEMRLRLRNRLLSHNRQTAFNCVLASVTQ